MRDGECMTYTWKKARPVIRSKLSRGFTLLMWGYQALSILMIPGFWILARRRLSMGKEEEHRIAQRFGMPAVQRPEGAVLWIHSASIGETRMALILAHQILENHPDVTLLMTTQTISAAKFVPVHPRIVHNMVPFDSIVYVRRFFQYWKPYQGVIFESERWPNLYYEAFKRHIPLMIVNAQLSQRSMRWWIYGKYILTHMLQGCTLIFTSSPTVKQRFLSIDPQLPIYDAPSLKYTVQCAPFDLDAGWAEKKATFQGRPYWLASCIHASELPLIYEVHQRFLQVHPGVVLVVIPRHPDVMIDWPNTAYWSASDAVSSSTQIYVVDGFGQTDYFYRRAIFCVFGGSFEPIGGHNIIEPVSQGCAVIHGPYTHACPELYERFVACQASCLVQGAEEVFQAITHFFAHPEVAEARAKTALTLYESVQKETLAYVQFLSHLCKFSG